MDRPTGLQPIARSRISHQAVIQLWRLIRDGYWSPGERLPPERELAEQLQVSRGSLREALRILEVAGVVESRQGDGTFVREGPGLGLLSPLAVIFGASGDLVGDLLEVRMIVEPQIAARAAVRATADEIAEMNAAVAAMASLLDREGVALEALEHDRAFHRAVARASHNEVAVRVIELINQTLQEVRRHFVASTERLRRAHERHLEILAAIEARDAPGASAAMIRHLTEIEGYILSEALGNQGDATATGEGGR